MGSVSFLNLFRYVGIRRRISLLSEELAFEMDEALIKATGLPFDRFLKSIAENPEEIIRNHHLLLDSHVTAAEVED